LKPKSVYGLMNLAFIAGSSVYLFHALL